MSPRITPRINKVTSQREECTQPARGQCQQPRLSGTSAAACQIRSSFYSNPPARDPPPHISGMCRLYMAHNLISGTGGLTHQTANPHPPLPGGGHMSGNNVP